MTNLTEKWKNGELEQGYYYTKYNPKVGEPFVEIELRSYLLDLAKVRDANTVEVLAPVPSYEELQAKESNEDFLQQKISVLESENTKLKAQIAKLTEIVGVLPSNHSVGNLGYKIKNQRHEINNRLKEIDKLKELLKESREWIEYLEEIMLETENIVGTNYFQRLLTRIDEALK